MVNVEDDAKVHQSPLFLSNLIVKYRSLSSQGKFLALATCLVFAVMLKNVVRNHIGAISGNGISDEQISVVEKNAVSIKPLSWTVVHPDLVEKRPSTQCGINKIAPQVFEPLVYMSKFGAENQDYGKQNGNDVWERRAFSCVEKCPKSLLEEFENRRWKSVAAKDASDGALKTWDATFVLMSYSKLIALQNALPPSYNELVWNREGVSYLNTFVLSIDNVNRGTTIEDVFGRQNREFLAQKNGCAYDALNMEINPATAKWLKFRKEEFIVRAHLLIASNYPFFAFTRLAHVELAKSKNILSLDDFQRELASDKITGSHYLDTLLYSASKKVLLYLFHTARQNFVRRRGSYLLTTVEFKVDESFHVYLNNIIPGSDLKDGYLEPEDLTEMLDLVQELHEVPVVFNGMVKGDKYGTWELLFSEKQESCEKLMYNPCVSVFEGFNTRDLRKANSKVAKVHNTANRIRHEDERVKKKMEEQKKERCRKEKLPYPSPKCDKMQQTLDQEKFERLFAEHEKSYNPYQFILAEPGEVFLWETV